MAENTEMNVQFTEEQLQNLVTLILRSVNTRISDRIVDVVAAGDTKHVPSADAVQKAILAMNHWQTEIVTGDLPETGNANTIYLQRDSEDDITWMLNIYANDQWIPIGDTDIDLSNYITKKDAEDTFVAQDAHSALADRVTALENADVVNSDDLANATANFLDKTNADDIAALKESLGIEESAPIADEKITEIVNAAFAASAPDLT